MLKEKIRKISHRLLTNFKGVADDLSLDHWDLGYTKDGLSLGGSSLVGLMEKWGSPLHVVNMQRLTDNLMGFRSSPPGLGRQCELFCSYKTNPIPGVLQHLHKQGAGAEVISEHELWLALRLGVSADKIVFNGPAKSNSSIETAIKENILSLNINHFEEIDRVQKIARKLGKKVNIGLRIAFQSAWTGQLGIPVNDALSAYRRALAIEEFNVVGIHCHRGFTICSAEDLNGHLALILQLLATLRSELGFKPDIVNIGGSLGVPTVSPLSASEKRLAMRFAIEPLPPKPEKTLKPHEYAHQVLTTIAADFSARGESLPRILIEPGRSLTGNSQLLLCRVISTKESDPFAYAILDAGINIADCMTSEFHQIFALKPQQQPKRVYRLVGPICHMGDTVRYACRLPTLVEGDALAIMDSGAYFVPDGRSFSFPQPGIVGIHPDGATVLLRAKETNEHLVALDDF